MQAIRIFYTSIAYSMLHMMLTGCSLFVTNVEEPKYTVVEQVGAIEVRTYPQLIIAEVSAEGERNEAARAGFRLLADYIFGNNIKQQDIDMTAPVTQQESQDIDMTAPVMQQESQDIDMTAPVMQQESQDIDMTAPVMQQEDFAASKNRQKWHIRFVMPLEYTIETLPQPKNPAVKIIEQPERTFVVIRFSGTGSRGNIAEHEAKLRQYMIEQNMTATHSPLYAFYNPPWTIPFFRRNEVMFQIQ